MITAAVLRLEHLDGHASWLFRRLIALCDVSGILAAGVSDGWLAHPGGGHDNSIRAGTCTGDTGALEAKAGELTSRIACVLQRKYSQRDLESLDFGSLFAVKRCRFWIAGRKTVLQK